MTTHHCMRYPCPVCYPMTSTPLRWIDRLNDGPELDADQTQATIDDLRARLAATEIKLAAARLALAACREVREARDA